MNLDPNIDFEYIRRIENHSLWKREFSSSKRMTLLRIEKYIMNEKMLSTWLNGEIFLGLLSSSTPNRVVTHSTLPPPIQTERSVFPIIIQI
jgi:hypothetical protein